MAQHAQAVVLCQRNKGQMQVGRFFVHVYHRRHDIFPSYPAHEEVRRPLEERLYLLWGFPLKKLRAGGYQRIDKPCAGLAGSAPGLLNPALNEVVIASLRLDDMEVYDIVLNFAKTDKRIRMVTLEGSRTNTNIPPDDFQDFDITFFVTDMDSFTSDDKWLDIFGERLILQKPEDMELFPAVEKGFSYLMLFTDDVKIDLTLLPLELIDEYFTWDKLVKLLLDKDNRIVKPPIPTDIDYHLQKPTQRMFDDCCNEFWNTTTYVVKGLCRKEILFAIDHMNDIVRKELLRMISWLIGIKQGFHFSLGKNYKFMKQYAPEELWERLMSTYNMDSYPHMWESFEQCMALFREVSSEVACQLDYQYPLYDEKISNYVIRQKKKYGIEDDNK